MRLRISRQSINRSFAGDLALFLILVLFAVFMVFPLVLTISNAFKPLDELWIFPPKLLPSRPTLRNFTDFFTVLSNSAIPIQRYLFNTIFITAAGTAGNILLGSMCAFVLAKKRFPGSRLMFQVIVLSLMFTGATTIPSYVLMAGLRIINTYWAILLPAFSSSLGLYLMKQFMEEIPEEMLEAARIDGAGQWKTFWRIVMPMVKPAWMTLILLSVQSLWNMGANSFIFDEPLKTLSYAVTQVAAGGTARAGVSAAASVLMLLVPIGIFVFTQTNIIETMSHSGMKD